MTDCHAFGAEATCGLCALVKLDAPDVALVRGELDTPDPGAPSEAAFWAHLARRTDGGPSTPRELAVWLGRQRESRARERARELLRSHPEISDLPIDAPF